MNKISRATLLSTITAAFCALTTMTASAALVTAEPDSFAPGTNISNAFSGVTLSIVGIGFGAGPNVFAVNPAIQPNEPFSASTGQLVFGTSSANFPHLFREDDFVNLRIDFLTPTDFVAIDFISNDRSDTGLLRLFDAGNNLLGSVNSASLSANQFATLSFTAGSNVIAYALAGGVTNLDSGGLDNLRFNVPNAAVPLPSTTLLLGLGFAGLLLGRKRVA